MAERLPPREGVTGAVLNQPLGPSRGLPWSTRVLLVAAASAISVLLYGNSPLVRALSDNFLLTLVLPTVLWAARWWFRHRVWPDDLPRDKDLLAGRR